MAACASRWSCRWSRPGATAVTTATAAARIPTARVPTACDRRRWRSGGAAMAELQGLSELQGRRALGGLVLAIVGWDLFNEAYNSLGREGGLPRPPADD